MKRIIVWLVLVLVVVSGCASFGYTNHEMHAHNDSSEPKTEHQVNTFDLTDKMNRHALSLDLQADTGTISWTLVDPAGEVQWTGAVGAGEESTRLDEQRDLPLMVGNWTLTLDMDEMAGHANADWQGHS